MGNPIRESDLFEIGLSATLGPLSGSGLILPTIRRVFDDLSEFELSSSFFVVFGGGVKTLKNFSPKKKTFC